MNLSAMLRRPLNWAIKQKEALPAPIRRTIDSVGRNPNSPVYRLILRASGYRANPAPAPTQLPDAETRVYIAPANYAGQGFLWARSLERFGKRTGARNMAVDAPGGYGFAADTLVPAGAFHLNKRWQDAQFERVTQFSHVLVEAERPLFGRKFGYDVRREIAALRSAGVSVALITHGSDTRNPRNHRTLTEWSPFKDANPDVEILQKLSDRNRELVRASGLPSFVPTPELLHDLPDAVWCPIVVEQERWQRASRPLFERPVPRVTHIPSRGWLKGTDLIDPVMTRLADEGLVEYRQLSGIPFAEMPGEIGTADIVLEQFRLGIYATTAIEAMAAGRIVVAHVLPSVREHIREVSGLELPVVEATPDTLEEVLRGLIADPERASEIGRRSAEFASAVHDGRLSARVLEEHWLHAE
ncbi:hypothetical protein JD292_06015 [Leucobacter sp. CSA2]|uniref:Glycosyl transferase family 1 domain-containing protein n=1 Tax=Leucobacter edaphi TaxID=2796472 RepID=A0A934UX40_9MICO|nr:glycosyltransferase [Leucobacter edaphi]MBK0421625.1 hypothetical protein [Leucobacter edaphi]